MYVSVKWHENRYMSRGGYWFLKIMYGDRRDGMMKYGWETATANYEWTAEIKARKMLKKAQKQERKRRHEDWVVGKA
jgi:hypothetical protein